MSSPFLLLSHSFLPSTRTKEPKSQLTDGCWPTRSHHQTAKPASSASSSFLLALSLALSRTRALPSFSLVASRASSWLLGRVWLSPRRRRQEGRRLSLELKISRSSQESHKKLAFCLLASCSLLVARRTRSFLVFSIKSRISHNFRAKRSSRNKARKKQLASPFGTIARLSFSNVILILLLLRRELIKFNI